MMNSKALLKELVLSGLDPAEAFMQANRELCKNNPAHMFLTAFIGLLDLSAGTLTCVNAGHNPPLLQHAGGNWEYLRIKHSLVLGATPRTKYHNISVPLASRDRLILYTDGVTEAKSAKNELFGEDRLKETLNAMSGSPAELIASLKARIEVFSAGVPQSDDITLLALDYSGAPTA